MSSSRSSKFVENQFLSQTAGRFPLMGEILADTLPRAGRATAGIAAFDEIMAELRAVDVAWNAGESAVAMGASTLLGASLAFDDRMAALRRKPDADTNSLLESWDTTIRGEVAFRGPIYTFLLPHGRKTLTAGSREEQLLALEALGTCLAAQTAKPVLVALGAEVTAYYQEVRALRAAQTKAKSVLEVARCHQETLRKAAATALYGLIGQGMVTWRAQPSRVETLWDVSLLRGTRMKAPAAPPDTTWDAGTRTLSTSALPAKATRLEAWRQAPGGMPELLLRGARGATALMVPANIVFLPGVSYQLWLTAANSRGRSEAGPVVVVVD